MSGWNRPGWGDPRGTNSGGGGGWRIPGWGDPRVPRSGSSGGDSGDSNAGITGGVHDTHVGDYHVIMTNLPPAEVNRITLEIYARWLQFALGQRALGGRMLVAPTGQYARSIQVQYEDGIAVGVIADPSIAPEAAILETGHQAVDLKTKLQHGRAYPMHRNIGRLSMGQRAQMWSEFRTRTGKVRTRTNTGYASIGPNSAPDSWIIPAMPAYSPSLALSEMAAAMAKRS